MRKNVLIADDSRVFLMYAGLLLKRMNYDVVAAESGIEALRLLRYKRPDLMIIDVHMETTGGLKLLHHMRAGKETSEIPVIMTSIDSGSAIIDHCKRWGCCAFLTKPLTVSRLYEVINRCLYQHEGYYRKHIRIPFNTHVLLAHDGAQHDLMSDNISEGGVYIKTDSPFALGSDVVMTIALENNVSIIAQGVVIHRNEAAQGKSMQRPGMAIEFTAMTADDVSALKNYIENIVAADILEGQNGRLFSR
jgi:two-component system cell cycle response regulator DivK